MFTKTIFTITLAAIGVSAFSQQTGFYNDGRPKQMFYTVSGLNHQDIKFLKTAQAGNDFEIRSSELALKNGSGEFVKEFAKEMIMDHGGAKSELAQVASEKSLSLSGPLPTPLEAKLNELNMLHGEAFDKVYFADQKAAHNMTINLFQEEIDHGHDQNVKSAAVLLLPTIEQHKHMLLTKKTMMGPTAQTNGS
jgi:putative membrane protein